MCKTVANEVWAFDAEWVPAPVAGRVLYGLSDTLTGREVVEEMEQRNGATEDDSNGAVKGIVQYNIRYALTTYLVGLRIAHFSGFLRRKRIARNRSVYEC